MSYVKFFAVPFISLRSMINRYVQFFFKIAAHPHIMIAHKKIYGDAAVCYFCKFTKQPNITPGYNGFIFIPEIKHISKNKNPLCIITDTFKKSNYFFFTYQAAFVIRNADMKV